MENRILPSVPSMSRCSSKVKQGDIGSFLQCSHFDPKYMASENKFQRQGELKRIVEVAVEISQDDCASGSLKGRLVSSLAQEELKKSKTALYESSIEARERSKIFSEALSVFEKFFPSIPSRKRSQMDVISGDRANAISLNDRPGLGPSIVKMGTLGHALINASESELQRSEERSKNAKRTRTSLLDARATSIAKQSTQMDKDGDVVRAANNRALSADDRRLPTKSWEKLKMKKKRSGFKADVSPSIRAAKPVDGHWEPKQGMQQRLVTESHGFRSGVGNGTAGTGKIDCGLQLTVSSVRPSIRRNDYENGTLFDKERANPKTVKKTSVQEEDMSSSPNSNTKLGASARAPQSNRGTLLKLSVSQQPTASSDWEIKPSAAAGLTRRKCTISTQSSSPPFVHWAGQRPQKISRTSRTNFLPVVSNNDETPSLDTMSDLGNDNGSNIARRFQSSSPQVKLKSAQLSESEELGVFDLNSKEKKRILDKADGQNVEKASTFMLSPRKKKLIIGEHEDFVRRQGKSNRSMTSTRSLMPSIVDRLGKMGTTKQLRASRMGFYKAESKADRPPLRKLSGRKGYPCHRHSAVHVATDFCGFDDRQQELLVAAKAAVDPSHLSLFWRHMELIFRFISEADISFLKQQEEPLSISDTSKISDPADVNNASNVLNGHEFFKNQIPAVGSNMLEYFAEQMLYEATTHSLVPLCQRLIAALVTDEEEYRNGSIEEIEFHSYETGLQLDTALQYGALAQISAVKSNAAMSSTPNVQTTRVTDEFEELGEPGFESYMVVVQNLGGIPSSGYLFDGIPAGSEILPITESIECQYANMSLDERLLLEIQSIGLFPEQFPPGQPEKGEMYNEKVSQEIKQLEEKYHREVSKKKRCFILTLLKSAEERREHQEKDFEQCALEKLMAMAYQNYMASCGAKGPRSKMMKQAALAFLNRTLEHCHKYEATGVSCFMEPPFMDVYNAVLNQLTDAQSLGAFTEAESGNTHLGLQQHVQNDELWQEYSPLEENAVEEGRWSDEVKKWSDMKGKRSDRDTRNGTTKLGRPVGNTTGDRKSKAKPKQKSTHQLSASVNGLHGKILEQPKAPFPQSYEKEDPVVDFSGLKIPEIDVELGGQGQDLASWLAVVMIHYKIMTLWDSKSRWMT